jgi:predicted regulator of Ras-like GTPase activity (Roadblock/LC7/MglB family)
MANLNDILKDLADDVPGFISADVVGMDGLSIAGYASNPDFDSEAAAAQFALVMKLVQKTADQLGSGEVEDNLVTTNNAYILTRFLGDTSYYLSIAVDKSSGSLGNVRLMTRNYAGDLWDAIPK